MKKLIIGVLLITLGMHAAQEYKITIHNNTGKAIRVAPRINDIQHASSTVSEKIGYLEYAEKINSLEFRAWSGTGEDAAEFMATQRDIAELAQTRNLHIYVGKFGKNLNVSDKAPIKKLGRN